MNSSRKILNQQKQDKDVKKGATPAVPEKKVAKTGFFAGKELKPIILTALCVIIALVLCIGVGIQQLKPKVVVTVDDTKITMDDMMYPIFEIESAYAPYNETYQMYMGTSFWEAEYQGGSGTGITNSVGLKQEVLNTEIQYEILYQKAVKEDYKLPDDEVKQAKEDAEKALEKLSWLQKARLCVSVKNLTERYEKRALADHYKEDIQKDLNKDVDEDEAIKDISKKDYRQYDVEYYYASTNKTDDEGNTVTLTDAEKEKLQKKFKEIAKKAKAGEDFTKLISEDEKDITFEKDTNFTEQAGFPYASEDNLKKIKKMKNGSVSEAYLDDTTGYYLVIKMIDNNSDEAYKTACDNAIKSAQDEAYQEWYTKEQEDHKIDINTDVWSDVTIGSVTTEIVTAEDIQKMSEDSSEENGSNAE